jgi:hypothetical protein
MRLLLLTTELASMMPEDLKELLRAFNDQAVKFLIVGGYAFGVHAEPRATKDLDIFVRSDEENSKAVFRALAQYGTPLGGLTPSDFMDGTTFQIGQPPARIDILQHIDGVTFDEASTTAAISKFADVKTSSIAQAKPFRCPDPSAQIRPSEGWNKEGR